MTIPTTLNSGYRVICDAMDHAGFLEEGQEPNSEQIVKYMRRLNDLINFQQTQGIKLWLQSDVVVPLVNGQATYNFSPTGDIVMSKPLRSLQGYYLDSSGNRRPIDPISREEYMRLSNVTQKGQLNSYFVDKQQSQLAVSFWLVPDAQAATGTAHLLLQQQVTNLISITDLMNFPQEWFMYLGWGLADDICTGQPPAIVTRCKERALLYLTALEGWDVEDASTRFTPDAQSVRQSSFI